MTSEQKEGLISSKQNPGEFDEQDNQAKMFRNFFRYLNISLGLTISGFGIYMYSAQKVKLSFDEPWSIFAPFYAILLGFILILAEFEVKFLLYYFRFLDNYFGRGLFDFFIATMATASINSENQTEYTIGWVVAGIFAGVGFFYLFIHCCCPGVEKQNEEIEEIQSVSEAPKQKASEPQQQSPAKNINNSGQIEKKGPSAGNSSAPAKDETNASSQGDKNEYWDKYYQKDA